MQIAAKVSEELALTDAAIKTNGGFTFEDEAS